MTKVKFYKDKDGDIFAYFPEEKWNHFEPGVFTCYAHIGQHSGCHEDYIKECEDAKFNEYWGLFKELIGQGYNDLQIETKQEFSYWRKPTDGDIKHGFGAIHYRRFPASVCVNYKTGDLKKWFRADDGLRYYN